MDENNQSGKRPLATATASGDDVIEDKKEDMTIKKQKKGVEESSSSTATAGLLTTVSSSTTTEASSSSSSSSAPSDGGFHQKYMNILEPMMKRLNSQLEEKTKVLQEMTQTMDNLENMKPIPSSDDDSLTTTMTNPSCIQVNFGGELVTIDRQKVCFNSHIRWNFFSALFHPRWEAILPKDKDGNIYLDLEYSWVKRILDAYEEVYSMNQQNGPSNNKKVFLPIKRPSPSSVEAITSTETYSKYVESAFGMYPTLQVTYSQAPHRFSSLLGVSVLDSVLFSDLLKETMGLSITEEPLLIVHANSMDYKAPNRFTNGFDSTFIVHSMDEMGNIFGMIWSARQDPNDKEEFTYHYRCFAFISDPRTRHSMYKHSTCQMTEKLKTPKDKEDASHLVDEYRLYATQIYTDRLYRLQFQSFMPGEDWNLSPWMTDFAKFESNGIEVYINERQEVKVEVKEDTTQSAKGKKGKAKATVQPSKVTTTSSFVNKKVLLMSLSNCRESKYASLDSKYWIDMGGSTLGQKAMQKFNLWKNTDNDAASTNVSSVATTTATSSSSTNHVSYTTFQSSKLLMSLMKPIDHELLPEIGGDITSLLMKDRDNPSSKPVSNHLHDSTSVLDHCKLKKQSKEPSLRNANNDAREESNTGNQIEIDCDLMKLITCANDEYHHLYNHQVERCYRKLLEINVLHRLLIAPGLLSSFDVNFYPVHINTISTFENLLATLNYRLRIISALRLPKYQKSMTDRILYFNVEGKTVCLSKEAISRCIGGSQLATRLCSDMWKEQSSTLDDLGRIIIEFPAEIFLPFIEHLRARFQFNIYSKVIFYETQELVDAAREMLNYFVITNVEAELYPKK